MNRRTLLLGMTAVASTACLPRRIPAAALPSGPITLGWRWVPGTTLTYRATITHRDDGRVTTRAERWSYLVRTLDLQDVATLEARLVGLGGNVLDTRTPIDPAAVHKARSTARHLGGSSLLRLGMNGDQYPVRNGTDCQHIAAARGDCFGDQLVHRMLALKLPTEPIRVHDVWSDPTLVAPFAALLPESERTSSDATSRLLDMGQDDHGVFAILDSVGIARSHDAMSIRVTSRVRWSTDRGLLVSRTLEARFSPHSDAAPGHLTLTLDLV